MDGGERAPAFPSLGPALDFGRRLVTTHDLDPVYDALVGAPLTADTAARWCVAYWLYYHAGVASRAAERTGRDFWAYLLGIVATAPRGVERRHFRGAKAVDALVWIGERFAGPEALVDWLFGPWAGAGPDFVAVRARATALPMFGPWIAWKLADMGERCLGRPVAFADDALGIYRDPRQGAALVATGDWRAAVDDATVRRVVAALRAGLDDLRAPPHGDRAPNVQEVETVLCKYKSHVKGHYPLGKDSRDVAEALHGYGPVADLLLAALRARCSEAS